MTELRWYLLIHQLPPKPLYLRAKIRQRLVRAGALPLKNSVYVLPRSEECLEDFQWIAQEAVAGGGEAWVCEGEFRFGMEGDALVEQFRRARAVDFEALAAEIRELLRAAGPRRRKTAAAEDLSSHVSKLHKRFDELSRIDFFQTPARHDAEMALHSLEARVNPVEEPIATAPRVDVSTLVSRTWVTRTGVQVDRIASAWLVRRFVDPKARFRFVPATATAIEPDELRFDMVGGDFTHEGDRCTFETLVSRLGLVDPAVVQIAQIVHDIDLKDGKFGRSDAAGVQQLILGLVLTHSADEARLERGFALLDDLYRSFSRGGVSRPAVSKSRQR